jgi:RHH-type proline utilization regulon transcriptional repressor/proline dehydrogenase/delta 1-pyrroline-5-carboxylate dehydrogenase
LEHNQLREWCDNLAAPLPADVRQHLAAAIDSYLHWAAVEFSQTHDDLRLVGEDNFRRYLPVDRLRIRLHAADTLFEVFARAAAARAAGSRMVVSAAPRGRVSPRLASGSFGETAPQDLFTLLDESTDPWAGAIEFLEETDEQLAAAMRAGHVGRVRYATPDRVPEVIRRASAESFVYVADGPVLAHGRVELLWYLREQSISHVYHRYGNLGRRAAEPRAEVT